MANLVVQRQTDTLKLEVLPQILDFREGRPTAETVAEKLGISAGLVRQWLADNHNAELLDEIVPLWPKHRQRPAVRLKIVYRKHCRTSSN